MPDSPLVYLILGAAGSGRREILADLIEGGLSPADRAGVLLSAGEPSVPADQKLGAIQTWRWVVPPPEAVAHAALDADLPHPIPTIEGELPSGATHVFFVTDGRLNPVDQVEAFKAWLAGRDAEFARVICVVHCRLAEQNPRLRAWFDACAHFADVMLLNRREGVANKWMSDFQAHFKSLFYPCLFEFVKSGRVHNPALILEAQALRMTHIFDEEIDLVFTGPDGEEIDEEDLPDDGEDDEEITATPEEDPYFARRTGGRRVKEIPDIAEYLR